MHLPALIEALPGEPSDRRFGRARQVAFLSALADCGAVRRASAAVGVSYRTAYRERRANKPFRLAWDAALLAARALGEDVLATRALDGVEEQVFYHGEIVATRRRYDSRLLLAHLARLDKLTEDARTRAWADDFEGALERFAVGEDDPAPVCPDCGEGLPVPAQDGPDILPPGQCDKCDSASGKKATRVVASKPPPAPLANPCPDCGGRCLDEDARLTKKDCQWFGNRLTRFYNARPSGVPGVHQFPGYDRDEVEAEQMAAFEEGVEKWWLVVPPGEGDDPDEWCFAAD